MMIGIDDNEIKVGFMGWLITSALSTEWGISSRDEGRRNVQLDMRMKLYGLAEKNQLCKSCLLEKI